MLVGVSCLIAVTVPQVAERGPQFFVNFKADNPGLYRLIDLLQLNRVYTSGWFLSLVLLITAGLCLTVWDQGSAALKAQKSGGRPVPPENLQNFSSLTVSGLADMTAVTETVRTVLKARGFKICGEDKNEATSLVFSKNATGRWGGFILHVGFLCVVVAGLYNLAFQQRGFVQLLETETFSGRSADWLTSERGLLAGNFDPGFRVHLRRFTPRYWDDDRVKSRESELVIMDKDGAREVVLGVDSPVHHNGVTLYQTMYYGYALTFILYPPSRQPVVTHFLLDSTGRRTFVGKTDFPTTDYIFSMTFHPDVVSPSFYLGRPGTDLTVRKRGAIVFKDRVLFGQQVKIENSVLHFADIHYWSGLSFVKRSGAIPAYIGFMVSCVGAFLIYFIVPTEMHVRIARQEDSTVIRLGGHARKYQALFAEELDRICQLVKTRLTAG